jgi:asparaginyl-tRNA synthetase
VANGAQKRTSWHVYAHAVLLLPPSPPPPPPPPPLLLLLLLLLHRYLSEVVFAKRPLIVTDYPKDIKAFYMRLNDDNQTVAAMDLLVPK